MQNSKAGSIEKPLPGKWLFDKVLTKD